MASAWTENGPISLPSRTLVWGAATAILLFAVAGVGMGFQASFRRGAAPEMGAAAGQAGKDDTIAARPIVDLSPPTAAPEAEKADDSDDNDDAKADALAAQTAEAQAIQAKPAGTPGDIDTVLASPTEKPPGSTKAPADEAPPGTPVKSDVPF